MVTTVEEIVLPPKADVQNLPANKNLNYQAILLESRKNYNSVMEILGILVSEIKELKKQGNADHTQITDLADRVIPEVRQTMTTNLEKIEEKTVGHGFRLNLIARNVEEVGENETHQQTEEKFRQVLREKLQLEDADTILFRDTHRLPKPKQGFGATQPKPLICAFIRQCDRDLVLSKAHMLKDSGMSIQSHLPPKLNAIRNAMLKERRAMLNANPARKIRVVDKQFSPVIQESKIVDGEAKWVTLKFEPNTAGVHAAHPRRSSRRPTINGITPITVED